MTEETTVTKTTKSKKNKGTSVSLSIFVAALPLVFLAGMFAGFQVWGKPNVGLDQANDEPARYEIPIYDDDPSIGPEDAPVTIVEFSDYECPYCRSYHSETFTQIMEVYGDQVRYVYKDLPLTSVHPNAVPAAVAAHCAQDQQVFWEYHDLLFSNELGLSEDAYLAYAERLNMDLASFESCLNSGTFEQVVMEDINILLDLSAPLSTPTFFINGQYVAGAQPFSQFASLIEAELE